ncbi:hypothetical protein GCM10023082_03720 [Streptomyces tremellae]|uniref:GAF domain-containing protein n=1 Tax=Streptomyces tremellae TaxID=1124239 RepID=A0ABP7DTN0_9ACTN
MFPLAEGATGVVVARRGPCVFDSYSEVRGGHVDPADRERLHATVAVPIEWRGAIIGVCVVFSTDPATRFTGEDVDLLGLFARHAAVAITNARLHREAEERARRLAVGAEGERVVRDVHDTVARALGSIITPMDAAAVQDPGGRLDAARTAARAALRETRRTSSASVPHCSTCLPSTRRSPSSSTGCAPRPRSARISSSRASPGRSTPT